MREDKQTIACRHKDNNNKKIFVDFHNVSDSTWYRDINEIREILYRDLKEDGQEQEQFSLSKNLTKFNVLRTEDTAAYKQYLQLLYFFYIVNYFIYPNVNIFKMLSEQNLNYLNSFDEGTSRGACLSFIASNLLDNKDVQGHYIEKSNRLLEMLDNISRAIKYSLSLADDTKVQALKIETVLASLKEKNVPETGGIVSGKIAQTAQAEQETFSGNDVPLEIMLEYTHAYTMRAYSNDMLNNLLADENIFDFEQPEIPPFNDWKQKYVYLDEDELEEFLNEDELYWFCRQTIGKIESRDRQKFLNSNAIKFLYEVIEVDKQWIETFDNQEEGLFIQIDECGMKLYALRIAIIIKTYNDLTSKMMFKIKSGNKSSTQPLRTALTLNASSCAGPFPATLPIRLFLLACHSQFLNVIKDHRDAYPTFLRESYYPEILTMQAAAAAYSYKTYGEWWQYLLDAFAAIQDTID